MLYLASFKCTLYLLSKICLLAHIVIDKPAVLSLDYRKVYPLSGRRAGATPAKSCAEMQVTHVIDLFPFTWKKSA